MDRGATDGELPRWADALAVRHRQRRTDAGYPWNGWNVDRKVANVATNLFGHGTPDHVESFFNTQYQPFDVTLSVTGNNLLSLTVLDDPEGGEAGPWSVVAASQTATRWTTTIGSAPGASFYRLVAAP